MYNGFIFDEKGVFYILTAFSSVRKMFRLISSAKILKAYLSFKKHFINIVGFPFSFKLKIIPNYRSSCFSIRVLERIDSYPIRLVSLSESVRSNLSPLRPLRYENHAEKNPFQWKQKAYPIWKLERSDSDPVSWKHSINYLKFCRISQEMLY